ncbi:phage tail protein I [Moraxella sp. Pampa]|uniref:phage tail protein I n=1 Tax=Moraxella sp. Pampa TaxID=3111978 RepID=UPI002B40E794|nr:phage tail protein I [Moraxella sp. Pampa]
MVINPLLPPNATAFEHTITQQLADGTRLDADIDTLNRIDEVGDDFLGVLAWQYSVDSWDENWQPSLKRELIKKSFANHELKGTRAAVRQILADFGYEATFIEWWQATPALPAGSFHLQLATAGAKLTEAVYQEINRLIFDAKPVSRHLTNLSIVLTPKAFVHLGVAVHMGDETIIYPKETP